MPGWLVALFALAGGTLTLVGAYKGLVKPMAKFITVTDRMYPLMVNQAKVFAKTPHVFEILDEIVGQVRTDSGSSLLDMVQRIDEAAKENRMAAQLLLVSAEAAKEMAAADRARVDRLLVQLDRLNLKVEEGGASLKRIEGDQASVAADLATAQAVVEKVAVDLRSSDLRTAEDREKVADNLEKAQQAVDLLKEQRASLADDLAVSQGKVEEVAADLAATHQRADEATGTESGDAADAGARSAKQESE